MKPAEVYILNKPEPFRSILMHVQMLIETKFPEIELKYKWKLPVYYSKGHQLCYLNVSLKKGYVDVGFWAKDILKEYEAYLVSENRTVVKSLRYKKIEDINEKVFFEILDEVSLHNHKGFWKK